MREIKIRSFAYRCKCGYEVKVFLDSGIPVERYKCRKCGVSIQRVDL